MVSQSVYPFGPRDVTSMVISRIRVPPAPMNEKPKAYAELEPCTSTTLVNLEPVTTKRYYKIPERTLAHNMAALRNKH